MKSKPAYESLSLDGSANRHLFIAEGAGLTCISRALADGTRTSPVRVLCVGLYKWEGLRSDVTGCVFESGDALKAALGPELESSTMDSAVYMAGSEFFLWDTYPLLVRAGVSDTRIRMETAGKSPRKVYCVHCATMNTGVTESTHGCVGCGKLLSIRDHFSRLKGAYMGVQIDAEVPNNLSIAKGMAV